MSGFWAGLSKVGTFLLWIIFLALQTLTKIVGSILGGKIPEDTGVEHARRESAPPPSPRRDDPRETNRQDWDSGRRPEWDRYEDGPLSRWGGDLAQVGYPVSDDYSPREYSPRSPRYRRGGAPPEGYMSRDNLAHSSSYSRAPQVQSALSRAPPMESGSSWSPPVQAGSSERAGKRPKLERKYSKIVDQYRSLDEVTEALAEAGLESSNLIIGIDFTKSNEWTGKSSFNGLSLHHIGDFPNPYELAISIIGQSLSSFDDDNLIPCYGFGDASTHDQDVFGFYPDERPCNGFQEALSRYREIAPHLRLSGPTSFAPIIEMATTIVEQSGGQYHVLLIIADGQVTRSVDTEFGQLSTQEQRTVDAIVKASEFPLSIILVGVGDGPWDMMREFDDNIPARTFDNFQFVNFTAIMSKKISQSKKEMEFALSALMEIPLQYKATLELGILGRRIAKSPDRVPLPPPFASYSASSSTATSRTNVQHNVPLPSEGPKIVSATVTPAVTATPAANTTPDPQVCPVCLLKPRDMAFGCGHQICSECGPKVEDCPICRRPVDTRIKLY